MQLHFWWLFMSPRVMQVKRHGIGTPCLSQWICDIDVVSKICLPATAGIEGADPGQRWAGAQEGHHCPFCADPSWSHRGPPCRYCGHRSLNEGKLYWHIPAAHPGCAAGTPFARERDATSLGLMPASLPLSLLTVVSAQMSCHDQRGVALHMA